MGGIGTVSVSPTYRQKGVAAELMQHALRAALDRGDVASALYPFRNRFYQKLGYGLAGIALQYLVPPSTLPPSEERQRVVLLLEEAQRTEALALYTQWIRTQTGHIERNPIVWERSSSAQDTALVGYRDANNALQGYALVAYRADLPIEERYLEVNEMIWMNEQARRGIFGWLSSLGDQWQRIMLRGLPSHHLTEIILEPRLPHRSAPGWALWTPAATELTGPMFRLLNLASAWGTRTAHTDGLAFSVQLVDRQIEENSGDWTLHLERAGAQLKRGVSSDVVLRLDISTLSRLYIGALKPTVALQAGLMECDRPEKLPRLDAALALPEPWMFDRF